MEKLLISVIIFVNFFTTLICYQLYTNLICISLTYWHWHWYIRSLICRYCTIDFSFPFLTFCKKNRLNVGRIMCGAVQIAFCLNQFFELWTDVCVQTTTDWTWAPVGFRSLEFTSKWKFIIFGPFKRLSVLVVQHIEHEENFSYIWWTNFYKYLNFSLLLHIVYQSCCC